MKIEPADVKYRTIQSGDYGAIYEVHHAALSALTPEFYTEQQIAAWQKLLSPNYYPADGNAEIVEYNGRIIAFGWAESAQVQDLYVHPNFWRQGFGSSLLKKLEQILAREFATVDLRSTLAAVTFYSKHDYQALGPAEIILSGGKRAPVVWMRKRLKTDKNSLLR